MTAVKDVRAMGEPRRVPLRDLRLDPLNPRLPADMQGQDQEELAVHLELGFDALTVAESIASHGYFEAYSEVDPTKIVGSIGAGQDMIRLAGSDL